MHLCFDYDDTIADFRSVLAKVLSKKFGYEVLPASLIDYDPTIYLPFDYQEVLELMDREEIPLNPGMVGLLNELLFCGHKVTVISARETPSRITSMRATLKNAGISLSRLDFTVSSTKTRASDVKALAADILIDNAHASIAGAQKLGLTAIRYGFSDRGTANLDIFFDRAFRKAENVPCLRAKLKALGVCLLPTVIGFMGKAGCGKDTAGHLVCKMNLGYQPAACAIALKQLARKLLDAEARTEFLFCLKRRAQKLEPTLPEKLHSLYQHATEQDLVCKTPLGRSILQQLGKEIVRDSLSPNMWITLLERRITPAEGQRCQHKVAITDVRFLNEAEFVERNAGIRILLERDNGGLQGIEATHASEALEAATYKKNKVYRISNNGTLQDLKTSLEKVLKDSLIR